VMNSLQLVQAVLTMQIRGAADEMTTSQLSAARSRVLAVATVHKQLHETGSVADVSVDDFMRRLCESLNLTAPDTITAVNVNADKTRVPSDLASGLGLVVAELVTNSFKYAYQEGQRDPVKVDFERLSEGWRLRVSDQGVGLLEGFDAEQTTGIGMRVVAALCGRLHGTLTVASRPGRTCFTVVSSQLTA
jgi:two-component sensor histidine kinase